MSASSLSLPRLNVALPVAKALRIGSAPAWATLAFGVVVLTIACLSAGW